jgi:hypothetical protein
MWGNAVVDVQVVGGDYLHQAGQGEHAEQALSHLLVITACELEQQQRTFSTPTDAVELPGQVADEGVPRPDGTVTKMTTDPVVWPPASATTTEPSPYTSKLDGKSR